MCPALPPPILCTISNMALDFWSLGQPALPPTYMQTNGSATTPPQVRVRYIHSCPISVPPRTTNPSETSHTFCLGWHWEDLQFFVVSRPPPPSEPRKQPPILAWSRSGQGQVMSATRTIVIGHQYVLRPGPRDLWHSCDLASGIMKW